MALGTTDRFLRWLPVAGLPVYLAAMHFQRIADQIGIPQIGDFFELLPLDWSRWACVVVMVIVATGLFWVSDHGLSGINKRSRGR